MDSSRLPKKAVAHVYDKEFSIEHLINRVKHSELADLIILCTTRNSSDDVLCEIAESKKIKFFRGSEKDKLERWNKACIKFDVLFCHSGW